MCESVDGRVDAQKFATALTAAGDDPNIANDMCLALQGTTETTVFKDAETTDAAPAAGQYTPLTPAQYSEFQQSIINNYYTDSLATIESLAAADPENASLQAQLAQAKIAAAQAVQANSVSDLTAPAASEVTIAEPVEIAEVDMPVVPAVTRIALDFSPVLALADKTLTRFPFSLISSLSGMFDYLIAEPVAPVLSWDWAGHHSEINFNVWDNGASTMRLVMAFMFHCSVIYGLIRRWS